MRRGGGDHIVTCRLGTALMSRKWLEYHNYQRLPLTFLFKFGYRIFRKQILGIVN